MHDALGRPLTTGDKVIIVGRVTDLATSDNFANVAVRTSLKRRPDDRKEAITGINTAVLLRANDGDENDLEEAFNTPAE